MKFLRRPHRYKFIILPQNISLATVPGGHLTFDFTWAEDG